MLAIISCGYSIDLIILFLKLPPTYKAFFKIGRGIFLLNSLRMRIEVAPFFIWIGQLAHPIVIKVKLFYLI
jgi:hypothetical protein